MRTRSGLHARFMAWFMEHAAGRYEERARKRKQKLLGRLEGTLVEIGSGTGPNLRYFPPTTRVVGVDPNPHMHRHYREESRRLGRDPVLVLGDAHALPFPDEAADAVVSTLVLCSVQDLDQALEEILRVLRPGGQFLFVEHVAGPPGSWTRRIQTAVKPLWRVVGEGCEPDRDTGAHLKRAGFRDVELERYREPLPVVGPHIAGIARK